MVPINTHYLLLPGWCSCLLPLQRWFCKNSSALKPPSTSTHSLHLQHILWAEFKFNVKRTWNGGRSERSAYGSPLQIWQNEREKLSTAQLRQERHTVTKHTTNAPVVAWIDVTGAVMEKMCYIRCKRTWAAAYFTVYYLMEKRGKLYSPFLMPSGTIAQVHQVLHLLHCFDGGHLETTEN